METEPAQPQEEDLSEDDGEGFFGAIFKPRDLASEIFYFRGIKILNSQTEILEDNAFEVEFHYNFANEFDIYSSIYLHCNISDEELISLLPTIFAIGMCVLTWYWMGYATNLIVIEVAEMDENMIIFWQTLYDNVLSEFKYLHKLSGDNFMKIVCRPQVPLKTRYGGLRGISYFFELVHSTCSGKCISLAQFEIPAIAELSSSFDAICPLGGGKDSLVVWNQCIELDKRPLLIYCADGMFEFEGSNRLQKIVELSGSPVLIVRHNFLCKLFESSARSYLNPCGHPWAALCFFDSALLCQICNISDVFLGHERSADEGNGIWWDGIEVNHQYDKSSAFMSIAQSYSRLYLTTKSASITSALSSMWEIEISKIFCTNSRLVPFHPYFLSCNESALLHPANIIDSSAIALELRDSWCCRCPKCCFVFLLVSAWLPPSQVVSAHPGAGIFPSNLFENERLFPVFESLVLPIKQSGIDASTTAHIKPFECIGTAEEACACVELAINQYIRSSEQDQMFCLPFCLQSLANRLSLNVNTNSTFSCSANELVR